MRKDNEPIKIRATESSDDAWLYVNEKSIEVCIWRKGYGTLSARITENQLRKILSTPSEQQKLPPPPAN